MIRVRTATEHELPTLIPKSPAFCAVATTRAAAVACAVSAHRSRTIRWGQRTLQRSLNRGAHLGDAAFGAGFIDAGTEQFLAVHFFHEFGCEFVDERGGRAGNGAAEFVRAQQGKDTQQLAFAKAKDAAKNNRYSQRRRQMHWLQPKTPPNAIITAQDAAKRIGYSQDGLQWRLLRPRRDQRRLIISSSVNLNA
jgi:hypothetical protein